MRSSLGPPAQGLVVHWIIETSQGFTDVGLYRSSKSVRAYAYLQLILSSQASATLCTIGNMASAFTAQKAFLKKL